MELDEITKSLALGIQIADERRPTAANARSGVLYRPGIGPHTESQTTQMAIAAAPSFHEYHFEVPYPLVPRAKCDLCLGEPIEWAIEIKMLRLMGDNGKLNDNMLMHILSPYPAHRSALTDCQKLATSGFDARTGIVIFGYDYDDWPMDPAIDAFERLASATTALSERSIAAFKSLIHPIHTRGRVFGWEILGSGSPQV